MATQSRHADPATSVLGDILLRALQLSAVVLFFSLFRAISSIELARSLGWFSPGRASGCPTGGTNCPELLVFGLVKWLYGPIPLVILGLLVLLMFLSGLESSTGPAVTILYGVVLALGFFASRIVWSSTGETPSPWGLSATLGLMALGVIILMLRTLWLTDKHEGTSRPSRHQRLRQLQVSLAHNRTNVVIMAIYFSLFLLIDQTSGQTLDAVRMWGFGDWAQSATTILGLASTLALALTVREVGAGLDRSRRTPAEEFAPSPWLGVGGALLLGGAAMAWGPFNLGVLTLGAFVFAIGLTAWVRPPSEPDSTKGEPTESGLANWISSIPFVTVTIGLSVAAVDRYWITGNLRSTVAMLALAACSLLLGAAVSSGQVGHLERPASTRFGSYQAWRWGLPFALVLVPLFTLTVRDARVTVAVAVGLLGAVVGYLTLVLLSHSLAGLRLSLPVALAAGVAVAVAMHNDPLKTATVLGTITLVHVATSILVIFGYGIVHTTTASRPPPVFEWLGFRRLPVLTLFLIWWLLVGALLPRTMHEVAVVERGTVDGQSEPLETPTLRDAFATWVAAQPELATDGDSTGQPVPMMLVATHGGGVRAAYWTGLVLDCVVARSDPKDLNQPPCKGPSREDASVQNASRRIFLASGVSGGSVGLAAYAQQMLSGEYDDRGWVREELGQDFAAPTVGWGMFHDLPNHVLGVPASVGPCKEWLILKCVARDRAGILEQSLDQDPDAATPQLRRTWDQRHSTNPEARDRAEGVPLLIFNSTLAGAKFGVVTSAAKLGHHKLDLTESRDIRTNSRRTVLPLSGTLETVDLLCKDRDLSLTTAAVLSARFPVVSPSGRVSAECGVGDDSDRLQYKQCDNERCVLQMVDGATSTTPASSRCLGCGPSFANSLLSITKPPALTSRRLSSTSTTHIKRSKGWPIRGLLPKHSSPLRRLRSGEPWRGSRAAGSTPRCHLSARSPSHPRSIR